MIALKRFLVFSSLATLLVFSCKQTKDSNKIVKGNVDSTIHQLNVLQDSIDKSWGKMSQNEEEMFFGVTRLLQEIESIPGHDPLPLDTLRKATERTKAIRYDQESMRQSALIDQYDEATGALINNVQRYANSVKGIEKYKVASILMEEIPEQYQKIYLNRVHYDFYIQDYNKILEKNKKRLEKHNPEFKLLKPKPMFQLSN